MPKSTYITKEKMAALFDECNHQYFGGVLKKCRYSLFKSENQYARYTNHLTQKGLEGHIWFSYSHEWDFNLFKSFMIHEMIHHYVRTIENSNGGIFRHNWRFRRQCRRLKREYGIIVPRYLKKIPQNFEEPLKEIV